MRGEDVGREEAWRGWRWKRWRERGCRGLRVETENGEGMKGIEN